MKYDDYMQEAFKTLSHPTITDVDKCKNCSYVNKNLPFPDCTAINYALCPRTSDIEYLAMEAISERLIRIGEDGKIEWLLNLMKEDRQDEIGMKLMEEL